VANLIPERGGKRGKGPISREPGKQPLCRHVGDTMARRGKVEGTDNCSTNAAGKEPRLEGALRVDVETAGMVGPQARTLGKCGKGITGPKVTQCDQNTRERGRKKGPL